VNGGDAGDLPQQRGDRPAGIVETIALQGMFGLGEALGQLMSSSRIPRLGDHDRGDIGIERAHVLASAISRRSGGRTGSLVAHTGDTLVDPDVERALGDALPFGFRVAGRTWTTPRRDLSGAQLGGRQSPRRAAVTASTPLP
jgi:hypothetical protein